VVAVRTQAYRVGAGLPYSRSGRLPYRWPTLDGLPYTTYPTVGLPYSQLRLEIPPRQGPPPGRGRRPPTRSSRLYTPVKVSNPRASRGASLVARGRFLEFPIQMGGAEVVRRRGTDPAHAPTHNNVGGYMRGKQMGLRKKGKDGATAAQGTSTALKSAEATASPPPPVCAESTRRPHRLCPRALRGSRPTAAPVTGRD
jgi:hypothetical protein